MRNSLTSLGDENLTNFSQSPLDRTKKVILYGLQLGD
jgi:hypothetical protein